MRSLSRLQPVWNAELNNEFPAAAAGPGNSGIKHKEKRPAEAGTTNGWGIVDSQSRDYVPLRQHILLAQVLVDGWALRFG